MCTCKSSGKIAQTTAPVESSGFHWNFRQPGTCNCKFPLESTEASAGTVFSLSVGVSLPANESTDTESSELNMWQWCQPKVINDGLVSAHLVFNLDRSLCDFSIVAASLLICSSPLVGLLIMQIRLAVWVASNGLSSQCMYSTNVWCLGKQYRAMLP